MNDLSNTRLRKIVTKKEDLSQLSMRELIGLVVRLSTALLDARASLPKSRSVASSVNTGDA